MGVVVENEYVDCLLIHWSLRVSTVGEKGFFVLPAGTENLSYIKYIDMKTLMLSCVLQAQGRSSHEMSLGSDEKVNPTSHHTLIH